MKLTYIYLLIIFIFTSTVCGCSDEDGPADQYTGSSIFTFDTAIEPTTLTQEDDLCLYSYLESFVARCEACEIENESDLLTFNGTLEEYEHVSLNDMDTHTYFFIRDPGCPDYFDYADHSYSNNILTITLDEFHQKDAACPAAIYQVYLVFKAEKNS